MSPSKIDELLGRRDVEEVEKDGFEEPSGYRAALIRPRPQMGFVMIEATGDMHGFMYHTINHPTYQVRNGEELISFTSNGIAVVMQGWSIKEIFAAIMRHTLLEVREYDGRSSIEPGKSKIVRIGIVDTNPKREGMPPVRAVK